MRLTYSEIKSFDDRLKLVLSNQAVIINQGVNLMSEITELKAALLQNMADLRELAQKYLDYIIAKDGIIAEKDQKIADLMDEVASGGMTIQEAKTAMMEAIGESQAAEDAMRAGLPGVPPVGGTPLDPSYVDQASFDAAVADYAGPEAVTLDGAEVKAGTSPSLDYFTHSADGSINTSGPTD